MVGVPSVEDGNATLHFVIRQETLASSSNGKRKKIIVYQ